MKFERATPNEPVGHPLAAALKDYSTPFVRRRYPRPATLEGALAAARGLPRIEPEVLNRLIAENEAYGNPAATTTAAPLREGACFVVAGQQPGLFGGTLLTFGKAAAACAIAEAMTGAGVPAVPLFWTQGEDHDLVEVNRFECEREAGYERATAPIEDRGQRLGDIVVDASVAAWSSARLLEAGVAADVAEAYAARDGERFTEWTLRVVSRVLGSRGLLVADPRRFRDLLRPFLGRAIRSSEAWHGAFLADTAAVRAAGFDPQVDGGAPGGLFLVDDSGRRRRLAAGKPWTWDDGTGFTEEELLRLLDQAPERFSPNVQLRALAQQALFPIAVHVGGPAEAAYFAQFPSLYAAAGLPLPAMIPRPSSVLLGPKEEKMRAALGLDVEMLLEEPDSWPEAAPRSAPTDALFAGLAESDARAFDALVVAAEVEPLRRAVESHREQSRRLREKLAETFRRDYERSSGVERNRRKRLAEWIRPKGRPQERILGLPHLLARVGEESVRRWLDALDPFDPRTLVCAFDSAEHA